MVSVGSSASSGGLLGYFFVATAARMQGFFMLRRAFNARAADILFATTCNSNSAPLWQKLGGQCVPDSAFEYLLPLRLAPIVEDVARRRDWPGPVIALARLGGMILSPFGSAKRRGVSGIRFQETRDWDLLARVSEACRDPTVLSIERSPQYLRWRFARTPARALTDLLFFTLPNGREGWCAIQRSLRGRRGQIRTATLLDLVWPRGEFDVKEFLEGLAAYHDAHCDMIALQGPCGLWSAQRIARLRRRDLETPRAWFKVLSKTIPTVALTELYPADGDSFD